MLTYLCYCLQENNQQRPSAGMVHAGSAALESARNVLKQLPPQDWVAGQVRPAMMTFDVGLLFLRRPYM